VSNLESINYFYPELILTGFLLVIIIAELFNRKRNSNLTAYIAIVCMIVTFIALLMTDHLEMKSIFWGMYAIDGFSYYFKIIFLVSTLLVILFSIQFELLREVNMGEYYICIIGMVLGLFLMSSATNLLMVYLSIELVSISSYILAGYTRHQLSSSEAALKYIIYGALSTGVMLYGMSYLYGLTGTLDIYSINRILVNNPPDQLTMYLSLLFILVGFGFKISAVPFHFWTPDVYEGAPTPITAYFSIAPKAAGFALFLRFFLISFTRHGGDGGEWQIIDGIQWTDIIAVMAGFTMTLGNLLAIPLIILIS